MSTNQPAHPRNLEAALAHIQYLLDKQDLVQEVVHKTEMPRHDLVENLVTRQQLEELRRQINVLHPADIAYVLESLPLERRRRIWELVDSTHDGAVLLEVSDAVRRTLIADMDRAELVDAAEQLESDEIADLVPDLPKDVVPELMGKLDLEDRAQVQSALSFPEGSVGALMDFEFVAVREDVNLDVVLRYLRRLGELPAGSNLLMVTDREGLFRGILPVEALLIHEGEVAVVDVMIRDPVVFHTNDAAEDAAQAFERYDLIVAPVVTVHNKLVGCLKVDAVLDLIQAESQKDLLAQAGLSEDVDLFAPVWRAARSRWFWLALNLVTAFIASRVIGQFEDSIQKIVALAALMPIVASVGGNTGNQTLALMIRGFALRQINPGNFGYLVRKEVVVALLNGLLWGGVMGGITWLLYGQLPLAGIMLAAMVLNLMLAALAGLFIPMALKLVRQDPALGSSILLTGLTDSMGFLIFLGLATLFLAA
ncbi:MAG: magnesium transporter [Gammaproteobacteria bacterium]|jgi:magnesium transporter|nr:magnesium transporter [Gammaproteobacteria bacterium]